MTFIVGKVKLELGEDALVDVRDKTDDVSLQRECEDMPCDHD